MRVPAADVENDRIDRPRDEPSHLYVSDAVVHRDYGNLPNLGERSHHHRRGHEGGAHSGALGVSQAVDVLEKSFREREGQRQRGKGEGSRSGGRIALGCSPRQITFGVSLASLRHSCTSGTMTCWWCRAVSLGMNPVPGGVMKVRLGLAKISPSDVTIPTPILFADPFEQRRERGRGREESQQKPAREGHGDQGSRCRRHSHLESHAYRRLPHRRGRPHSTPSTRPPLWPVCLGFLARCCKEGCEGTEKLVPPCGAMSNSGIGTRWDGRKAQSGVVAASREADEWIDIGRGENPKKKTQSGLIHFVNNPLARQDRTRGDWFSRF